jgi:antitoxin MazE
MVMEISIVQTGCSKGIKLSKTRLKKYNIRDKVELIFQEGHMVLKPKYIPGKGWKMRSGLCPLAKKTSR